MTKLKWQAQYTSEDVRVEDDRLLYNSFFQFRELKIQHKSFRGNTIEVHRDLFCKPDAVAVLLFDAKLKSVVLIEQFRVGALSHPRSPWLLELVAGLVEPGETIDDVAKRECFEESGLEVVSLEHIYRFSPSPGGVKEYIDLFFANVDSSKAQGLHGLEEEGEDIKVHVFSAQTAFDMVKTGEIDNAPAIMALQWLELKLLRDAQSL